VSRGRIFRLPLDGTLAGEVGGSGPPLLLIHGWALDRRMWAQQRRAFRGHFTTVSYDRRGFGQSTCAAGFEQEVDDIDAILHALQIPQAALLGMSQGGRVALRYALARPAAVSALILHGAPFEPTAPPMGDAAHLPVRDYAALLEGGQLSAVHAALAAHPLMHVPEGQARARASIARMIEGYRGEDLLLQPNPAGAGYSDVRDRLSAITVPTLVLTGDTETPWLVTAADRLAAALPQATRAVVRGGGHMINMTAPRAYNRAVIAWLTAAAAITKPC
jgi:pimeloyl-ACP methyl ester carboxylesterase